MINPEKSYIIKKIASQGYEIWYTNRIWKPITIGSSKKSFLKTFWTFKGAYKFMKENGFIHGF